MIGAFLVDPGTARSFPTDVTGGPEDTKPPVRAVPPPMQLPVGFQQAIARGTRTADGRPGPAYWQQESAYTLKARIFPDEKKVEGSARVTYTNNSPDSLYVLHFELVQNLHQEGALRNEAVDITGGIQFSRITLDGLEAGPESGKMPRYLVSGTQLIVITGKPIRPGTNVELEMDWSFVIPRDGASGRMGYSEDNLIYLAYWYPILSVYDDVDGWHSDAFLGRSEFYSGFASYDVTIEAPSGWIVMGTGDLQNASEVLAPDVYKRMEKAHASDKTVQIVGPDDFDGATRADADGRLEWHFTSPRVRDVAYSLTRASIWDGARTKVGDRDGDGKEDYSDINTFYRATAHNWEDVTRYQQHAITFLSSFTGLPYPWPHMTAVEGGGIIGGGMEYPMMTLIGDYNAAGSDALYYVTAHELAHMWVPMIVSTDERRYSWLDEGSTTFTEDMARNEFFPDERAEMAELIGYIQAAQQDAEGEIMRWSNFHYSGYAYQVASYPKPAAVLVALKSVLGEETFNKAYRTFIHDWAYKHPYPYDFFNTFERVSGRDLDWFWQSWYFTTWKLDQAIASVEQSGDKVDVHVRDAGLIPMPVRLELTMADGTVVHREIPVETWLQGTDETTLTVETDKTVARVEIDPAFDFPDVDRSNNVWSR